MDRGVREANGDGASGLSVKAFHLGNLGNWKISGRSIGKNGP